MALILNRASLSDATVHSIIKDNQLKCILEGWYISIPKADFIKEQIDNEQEKNDG